MRTAVARLRLRQLGFLVNLAMLCIARTLLSVRLSVRHYIQYLIGLTYRPNSFNI